MLISGVHDLTTVDQAGEKFTAGDIEDVGTVEGRWELSGGTGSYAGITGGCPYETTFLPGDRAVSTADCTWER